MGVPWGVISGRRKDHSCGIGMEEPAEDTSDDGSNNEETLPCCRSISNISPQPYRPPEHTPSA
jgi:hypothetical protein